RRTSGRRKTTGTGGEHRSRSQHHLECLRFAASERRVSRPRRADLAQTTAVLDVGYVFCAAVDARPQRLAARAGASDCKTRLWRVAAQSGYHDRLFSRLVRPATDRLATAYEAGRFSTVGFA